MSSEASHVIDSSHAETKVNRRTGREVVNQWEILSELGKGSYGVVYKVRDINNKHLVGAMKVMNKTQLAKKKGPKNGPNPLDDVRREIAIMRKLDHVNVVKLHEVIDDPDSDDLYLIMEYLPGGPCMKKDTPALQEKIARSYMRDVILGLEYCHDNDIIHHDLKPDNILIGVDDSLKICDFGVSMLCQGEDDRSVAIRGTPPFLAPEVVTRTPESPPYAGRPVDVWAAGITLYMFMFRHPPFKGKDIQSTFKAIASQRLTFPHNLSPELTDFIKHILDKNPDTRFTIPQIREHPWLTMQGNWPLPSKVGKEHRIEVSAQDMADCITQLIPLHTVIALKMKFHKKLSNAKSRIRRASCDGEDDGTDELFSPTSLSPTSTSTSTSTSLSPSSPQARLLQPSYAPPTVPGCVSSATVSPRSMTSMAMTSIAVSSGIGTGSTIGVSDNTSSGYGDFGGGMTTTVSTGMGIGTGINTGTDTDAGTYTGTGTGTGTCTGAGTQINPNLTTNPLGLGGERGGGGRVPPLVLPLLTPVGVIDIGGGGGMKMLGGPSSVHNVNENAEDEDVNINLSLTMPPPVQDTIAFPFSFETINPIFPPSSDPGGSEGGGGGGDAGGEGNQVSANTNGNRSYTQMQQIGLVPFSITSTPDNSRSNIRRNYAPIAIMPPFLNTFSSPLPYLDLVWDPNPRQRSNSMMSLDDFSSPRMLSSRQSVNGGPTGIPPLIIPNLNMSRLSPRTGMMDGTGDSNNTMGIGSGGGGPNSTRSNPNSARSINPCSARGVGDGTTSGGTTEGGQSLQPPLTEQQAREQQAQQESQQRRREAERTDAQAKARSVMDGGGCCVVM